MPDLFIWIAVFVVTLITLIISADFFIKSSERIGLAAGIPPFIVGVTLKIYGAVKNMGAVKIGWKPFIVVDPIGQILIIGTDKTSGPRII